MNAISQIHAEVSHEGTVLLDTIEMAANGLARMMQAAHGGTWTAAVDHAASGGFVLVKRETERRIAHPKRGEVV